MKIRVEETTYEGTGTEIMDQLRGQVFDPTEFPDTESYLWYLWGNYIRMTGLDCELPQSDTETQARAMLYQLAKIGALALLEED